MKDLERFASNPAHPLHHDCLDTLARRALADAEPDRLAALVAASDALRAALTAANGDPADDALAVAKWRAWRHHVAANDSVHDPADNGKSALALARAVVAAADARRAASPVKPF